MADSSPSPRDAASTSEAAAYTRRKTTAEPALRARIGWVVAGSLATGLVAALLLVAAPFVPPAESNLTGAVLIGFALGWAMLALLSARFTCHPQRWAVVPAILMGAGGLLLPAFGSVVREPIVWVWPPAVLAMAVWMVVRIRRQLPSRSSRWMLYPVIAVLALASTGGAYQAVGDAADARAYPMPGQLVDVGGRSLHLSCTGSGGPTVVLQPGAGAMSSHLGWITPAIAHHTRVCVYDRAGRGWSDPADTRQDATDIATDLHTLLQRAHVPGPYVLAGHSFGGLYALTYAARYPQDVVGMVLVDSTAPVSAPRPATTWPRERDTYDLMGRASTVLSTSARLGLGSLYAHVASSDLPPQAHDEVRARMATAQNLRGTIEEYLQAGTFAQEAAALDDLGNKPLVVLTAGTGSRDGWTEAQNHLATLSTNSVHRVIAGATHQSLVGDEKDAATTSQAVIDVVSATRSGSPLAK